MTAPLERSSRTGDDGRGVRGVMVPKICGADIELGTFIVDQNAPRASPHDDHRGGSRRAAGSDDQDDEAARAVLAEIDGVLARRPKATSACGPRGTYRNGRLQPEWVRAASEEDPQDRARRFLPSNGGCVYIDLDHLELCLPEVTSAHDHVAAWHAMLRIAGDAQRRANAEQPRGRRVHLLANNSDGHGHSYGSHLDFLVTRQAFNDVFHRRLHQLLWLASFQVSSIIYTGAGKIGGENGFDDGHFQLSQRADFFESLVGPQTTMARPIVNSRDEPLCGRNYFGRRVSDNDAPATARMHVIFFDNTLCHVSSMLKVGVMQVVLAMLEAGWADLSLAVEDPIGALRRWSRDLTFQARAPMLRGQPKSAIELQTRFFEQASDFVDSGASDGIVPRAAEIMSCWADTLDALRRCDVERLSARLDWALKLELLGAAMRRHPSLGWNSPQLKHLDHLYSSLDPDEGLYWACESEGRVERVVEADRIAALVSDPPEDTRAWTRAHLLRRLGARGVDEVDWDLVRCGTELDRSWNRCRTIHLSDPRAFGRAEAEPLFNSARSEQELLDLFERAGADQ